MPAIASRRVMCGLKHSGRIDGVCRLICEHTSLKIKQWMLGIETNAAVSGIAAAIGEPARARMLYCLIDGHARTSTELAIVAEVSPSDRECAPEPPASGEAG